MAAVLTTLMALFAMMLASLAGMVVLVRRERRSRERLGLREWSLGLGMQVLAWPLFIFAATGFGSAWQALGCGLLVAGFAGMGRALLRALPTRATAPGPAIYAPAALLAALLLLSGNWPPAWRIGLFWLMALATLAPMLRPLLAQMAPSRPWSVRMTAGIFVGAGVVMGYRLVEQWLWPQAGPALGSAITPAQVATLVYFTLAPIIATFGFILIHHEHQRAWLEDLATFDALTGVRNRRAFLEDAAIAVAPLCPGDAAVAVLMVDVDELKPLNDRHGHAAGDRLLIEVAARLQDSVRERDLVGRYGGDEFCVLLLDTRVEEATAIAEGLRRDVAAATVEVAGAPVSASVSIGIAHGPARDADIEKMLRDADHQLYAAKRSGRNRVIVAPGPFNALPGQIAARTASDQAVG